MLLDDDIVPQNAHNDPRTDEELLALSVADPSVYGLLVDRYQEPFIRKAERVLQSRDEAEDAVQETFTKIYMNAAKFRPVEGASFKSWGYKILMHTAFTKYKKIKKERGARVEFDPDSFEIVPDMTESFYDVTVMRDMVATTLAKMPEKLADALRGHFIEDKPQKEMADEDGVGVGVIKTRVLRAKKAFKKLSESFVD